MVSVSRIFRDYLIIRQNDEELKRIDLEFRQSSAPPQWVITNV